jgi:hypothetical protein
MTDPKWLQWAKTLQTMAQTGLTYSKDPYDIARYELLQQIAFEMMATHSQTELAHIRHLFEEENGHATPKVDVRAVTCGTDSWSWLSQSLAGWRFR